MEITPSQLCKLTWYGIFLPKSKFKKITYHPWKVLSFTSNEVMLQNQITRKSKIVAFSDFNRYFATHERLDYLLHHNYESNTNS